MYSGGILDLSRSVCGGRDWWVSDFSCLVYAAIESGETGGVSGLSCRICAWTSPGLGLRDWGSFGLELSGVCGVGSKRGLGESLA